MALTAGNIPKAHSTPTQLADSGIAAANLVTGKTFTVTPNGSQQFALDFSLGDVAVVVPTSIALHTCTAITNLPTNKIVSVVWDSATNSLGPPTINWPSNMKVLAGAVTTLGYDYFATAADLPNPTYGFGAGTGKVVMRFWSDGTNMYASADAGCFQTVTAAHVKTYDISATTVSVANGGYLVLFATSTLYVNSLSSIQIRNAAFISMTDGSNAIDAGIRRVSAGIVQIDDGAGTPTGKLLAGKFQVNPFADTYASTNTIDVTKGFHNISCNSATSATSTFTPSAAGSNGDELEIQIRSVGAGTVTITFASTFLTSGTLAVTTGKVGTIGFRSNGTNWVERYRTTAV